MKDVKPSIHENKTAAKRMRSRREISEIIRKSDHQFQEIHAHIARLTRVTTREIFLMPMRQINISVAKAVIASLT
jgi:hypothetical protein